MLKISLFIIFPLLYLPCYAFTSHNDYDEQRWKVAGEYVGAYFEPTKKPCDAFFDHVCGNYGDKDVDFYQSSWVDHRLFITEAVLDAINKTDVQSNRTTSIEKSVREFFDVCVKYRNNAWDEDFDLAVSNYLQKIFGIKDPSFYGAKVRTDEGNNMTNDGLNNSTTSGPDTSKSTSDQPTSFNPERIMGRIRREAGISIGFAITPIIDRQGPRFAIHPIDEKYLDKNTTLQLMSYSDLQSKMPDIDWDAFFDEFIPNDMKEVFSNNHPNKIFEVYRYRELNIVGEYLKKNDTDLMKEFAILAKKLVEKQLRLMEFRWKDEYTDEDIGIFCAAYAMRALPAAVARIYFSSHGDDILEWRNDIITLGHNIVSAFRFLLNNVDWISSSEKEKIHKKIDDIVLYSGIPDWITNDNEVMDSIQGFTYDRLLTRYENQLNWLKLETEWGIRVAASGIKKDDKPDFSVQTSYSRVINKIDAQLGLFTPPRYHIKYPLAVKYGGYGALLAHELIHAFDFNGLFLPGLQYDGPWLQDIDLKELEKRKSCLVRQYSENCFPKNSDCVKGNLTINENIADIDGLKVAYTAFKFASHVFGKEPPIPAMLNYTSDQLFFLTTGRSWCSRGLNVKALADVHTPDKPRVETMLKNVPVFARAFKCPVGSTYAPLKICSLWGDLDNPSRR